MIGRHPVFVGLLALGCGGARPLVGMSQPDATVDIGISQPDAIADIGSEPVDFDASDLPYIEVDCTPAIAEIGRFFPVCNIDTEVLAGADALVPIVDCARINDAGGFVGSIGVELRRPQEIVIGQPMIVGGTDPAVSIWANSGSVVMGLVQAIPGSDAGSIVIDAFEPGRLDPGTLRRRDVQRLPAAVTHSVPHFELRVRRTGSPAQLNARKLRGRREG